MSTTPEAAVAATMSLRWAKCGDVYYAALLVPNEEAPIPVESGHAFVIFLGDETGAALPLADIEPYNPHDITRTSHPEAAAGVLIAQQLIAGAEAAAAAAAGEGEGGEQEQQNEEEEEWVKGMMAQRDHSQSLHEGSQGKKKEKKSKSKKDKHADKNDGKDEEREELMTRRLRQKKGRRHDSEEEEDNEEEDALLLPNAGSKRSRREREEEPEEEEEEDDDDDTNTNSTSSSEISSEGRDQQNRWDEMAEDLNITSPSRMNGRTRGSTNNNNKRSTGSTSAATASQQIALYGSTNVTPFLAEIHHHYLKAIVEASESDRLVSIQECDLVRAVEQELRSWSAEVGYLEQLLQDVEHEYNSLVSQTSQNDSNNVATVEEEAAAIRNRLSRLKSSFSLERLVREHLHLREKPAERRERKRPVHSSSSAAAVGTTAFIDPSMAYLLDTKAAAAVPRELTHTLAQRYREQRIRRERLLSSQQGLGKTGFTAPVSQVMEKWRRSRELMLIDPCRASQPVSRRYSESLAKVERHALKCLSAYSNSATGAAGRHSVDGLRSAYQQQQQQQQLPFKAPSKLYNFNDLNEGETQLATTPMYQASSSHPYMPNNGMHDDNNNNNDDGDGNDEGQNTFHVPLISPLRTSFDPRATFVVDPAEIMHEKTIAEQLAMKSMQYSQSIFLPSEETAWEGSEAYDAVERKQRTATGRRSISRASSRASSVVSDNTSGYNSANYGNSNKAIISNGGKKSETERKPRSDWRASAKRTILEQLTLYLRGRRGKPAVLNKDQFQFIAKKLLDRAVRSESERTGLSMSLQANNANTPFTKDIELRLRKSVDNYIQRHFAAARTPAQQQQYEQQQGRSADRTAATSMERTTSVRRGALQRADDDDETRSVMGAHPHTTDSPVYDDL
ncbi:uncharacterized protein TM35_000281670 [Trypanosoma theileri]|uniref:Uncharacterized protein n=1 Tax=Trypanosoma theileri TaxID=67003 RepID=A0A1X0NPB9_9TRYP|nr:uncharacterized protein TM35_000281670 [Trypanosoma theileri]ORC86451.1 hypothetical protein TM35_000281670 [Trypanosoma theileri]